MDNVTSRSQDLTTLDLLKSAAVLLMVIDHLGLYLVSAEPFSTEFRLLGRPASVIFGFLIGFSASRRVPPSWILLGVGLSLLDSWLTPDVGQKALDILIVLALTRIAMPLLDALHEKQPLLLVPVAIGCALLHERLGEYLEYGGEVPVAALLGVAVRLNKGRPGQAAARDALTLVGMIAIGLIAIRHFEFQGLEAAVCIAILGFTFVGLSRFERKPATAPLGLGPLLHFIGRNTLWIYALHLAALMHD